MSDEPGTVLEEADAPVTEPTPELTTPVEPTTPTEPPERKMVPLEQLQKERSRRQEAEKYRETVQPVMVHLRQLQQQNPALIEALRTGQLPTAEPVPAPNAPNPQLEQMAKTLELYTADGKPDVGRATVLAEMIDAQATARTDQMIKERVDPLAAQTASGQSAANYQRLLQTRLPDGSQVDKEIFDHWWNALGAQHTQDPTVAATAVLQAIGQQVLAGKPFKKAPPAPGVPLVTDAAGGRGGPVRLSAAQERIAKEIGVTPEQFKKDIEAADRSDGVLETYE